MTAYYNEFDPFAASWLKELIKDGLITDGEVDDRSITEVSPSDLKGFKQCHFFAGIGGWSMALRLADWPDDRPVWTGSPPCQPFSVAGNQKGTSDERHLWPAFFDLIREQAPPTVFGEQVASAIRHGWFDDLQKDLENQNYASAMAVLPACSVGAPHKRERLWFVANRTADTESHGNSRGLRQISETNEEQQARKEPGQDQAQQRNNGSESGSVANTIDARPQGRLCGWSDTQRENINGHPRRDGSISATANTESQGGRWGEPLEESGHKELGRSDQIQLDAWGASIGWPCRDGKTRIISTEPALFPLVDGIPNRVGILRGAGNAIVPQVAAEVIKAFMVSEDKK